MAKTHKCPPVSKKTIGDKRTKLRYLPFNVIFGIKGKKPVTSLWRPCVGEYKIYEKIFSSFIWVECIVLQNQIYYNVIFYCSQSICPEDCLSWFPPLSLFPRKISCEALNFFKNILWCFRFLRKYLVLLLFFFKNILCCFRFLQKYLALL